MNFRHPSFYCLVCGKLMNNLTNEQVVGDNLDSDEPYDAETYALCEWCGAAYLITTNRNRIPPAEEIAKMNPRSTWKFVPDALLPADVRAIQLTIRSTLPTTSSA